MKEQSWFDKEEKYLENMEKQCNILYQHHTKDHMYYNKLSSRFNIPILIVSSINALTAICLNDFLIQRYVSILNAVLSAGTGVLGSIQLYMKINEKMTNSTRSSMIYKKLALKISKELSIDRELRGSEGQSFLGECFSEFNTALEQGNPVEKKLINHLDLEFAKNVNVSQAFTPRDRFMTVANKLKNMGESLTNSLNNSPKQKSESSDTLSTRRQDIESLDD
jgi:hypothetical protein